MKKIFVCIILSYTVFWGCSEQVEPLGLNVKARSFLNQETRNLDSALHYAEKAIQFSKSPEHLYYSYQLKGYVLDEQKKYAGAIAYYRAALKVIPTSAEYEEDFAKLNLNIGRILKFQDKYQEAIDHYELALKFAEGDDRLKLLYNIGLAYKESQNELKAVEYLEQALVIARSNNDDFRQAKIFNQLGVMYRWMGETTKARDYYFKVLAHKNFSRYNDYAGKAYHNIAGTYVDDKDYLKADEYYLKALDYRTKDKDLFLTYMDLGNCKLLQNEKESSLIYLLKAEKLFPSVRVTIENANVFFLLSQVHSNKELSNEAVKKYNRYVSQSNNSNKKTADSVKATNYDVKVTGIWERYQQEKQLRFILQFILGIVLLGWITRSAYNRFKKRKEANSINKVIEEIKATDSEFGIEDIH
ncbi:MAG: tetratricopeptide repeat protein [bacterium]|nr:tetratricopeptide repeat protein [bacterium]